MELEETILERLQELRKWQAEQQERLLKQQQEQRDLLSLEQDRMYQALGLSVQGIVIDDSLAEQIKNSPIRDFRLNDNSHDNSMSDKSSYKHFEASDEPEKSSISRDVVDHERIDDQPRIELNIPELQLTTNRYLNFKSSIETFSSCSEIPADHEDSIIGSSVTPLQSKTNRYLNFKSSVGTFSPGSEISADLKNFPVSMSSVPRLNLTPNRCLNFKSSIGAFSPRSEIPADRDDSIVTVSSEQTPEKHQPRGSELSMDGVEPLPLDKPPNRQITLDDVPVPSPRKDFTTMLEERLRDCEASDDAINDKNEIPRVKRPFLRKGEGLARFKPNPAGNGTNRRPRQRSKSLSASMHLPTNSEMKSNTTRLKDTPKSSRNSRITSKNFIPPVAQQKLSLKNVAPPKKTAIRSKSASAVPNRKTSLVTTKIKPQPVDMNVSSDIETKNRRELEEMRIFELLEEKAENSSFCSNSSTVLALFRQSTPSKGNNSPKNTGNNFKQPHRVDSSKIDKTNDTNLEEIVRSTKSNLMPSSPVTKIRETVIKKDYLFSLPDENINNGNSDCVNRAIATGSYKSMKQTTIQFNNNNINSNNNNNFHKSIVDSDDETEIYDSTCRKNVDIGYEENYCEKRIENEGRLENERGNVSLHVRFSEYNEYKTIGLTDTSMMSNDSSCSKNYTEEKAWSDRSTSPDSSDVEVLYSNGKSKITSKALPVSLREKELGNFGTESTDQNTDEEEEDEEYTSSCSNDTSYDADNTITEMNVEGGKSKNGENRIDEDSENCNDSGSMIRQDNNDKSTNEIVPVEIDGTIFKSELLKTRLLELEREIDIFRKENTALADQRKKLQEQRRELEKEFKRREDDLLKEIKLTEESMMDERKRLAREKAALENRLRDARGKSLQNKQERHETQILREQLDELREETSQKESRWQAAQARQKSQLRVLQTENTRLKDELEKMRASRTNNSRIRRPVASNTRAIHQINKKLESGRKAEGRKDSSSEEETVRSRIVHRQFEIEEMQKEEIDDVRKRDVDGSKTIVYAGLTHRSTKSDDEPRKKRNFYANLLNEATEDLRENNGTVQERSANGLEELIDKSEQERMEDDGRSVGLSEDAIGQGNSANSLKRYESIVQNRGVTAAIMEEHDGNLEKSTNPIDRNRHVQPEAKSSVVSISPKEFAGSSTMKDKQDIREIRCPDGHVEFWFPNGNVKKIYPDRKITKMIYYNGDVRETAEDGTVKYFYSSTKTWHTTLPDGLEILEFADGQIERRTKNGTNEVSFPDGSVRLLQSDGMEKWVLPDGTVAETFPDGNKILSFPNGQREIHTKEHRRREYPDGTMKLVYPDGTQETRYSTGRVRIKDKDGNLLMDVHHR